MTPSQIQFFMLATCFQQPVDDEDTAANKLENNFLLPLLQAARKDPCTASNAVNKVRDLEVSAGTGAGLG